MKKNRIIGLTVGIAVSLFCLTACHSNHSKKTKPQVKAIPVQVVTAKEEKVNIHYKSVGSLVSRKTPTIKAQARGNVEQLLVHEGEVVKFGQTLAKLSREDQEITFSEAEAKVISAKATLQERKMAMNKKGILAKKGIVSKLDYAQATAEYKVAQTQLKVAQKNLLNSEYQLARTTIISPISGYVAKILVSEGEFVTPGTPLFKLVNHQKLHARLPFSEEKASQFKVGQSVHLESVSSPGKFIKAKVTAITPAIDPINRAMFVIVEFPNQHGWRAGSSVHGRVYIDQKIKAIVIPREAVVLKGNGLSVFVIKNNKAYERPVEIGYETARNVMVFKGLKPGDNVVTLGVHYLSDKSPVKIVNAKG